MGATLGDCLGPPLRRDDQRGEPPVTDIVRLLRSQTDATGLRRETQVATWQRSANCLGVDPDLFFPERGGSTREAKEVCRGCVVREECLQYALENGEKFGIWGGLSERERRRLRRRRNGAPYRVSQAS
jgi:WhiB family transcriptional regulator, redox-sensing transcriptional regulator